MRVIVLCVLVSLCASRMEAQTPLNSYELLGPAQTEADVAYRNAGDQQWAKKFKVWMVKDYPWLNYIVYYYRTKQVVIVHHPLPTPPIWLQADCVGFPSRDTPEACRLYEQWKKIATSLQDLSGSGFVLPPDSVSPHSWFRVEFHVDAMYSAMSYGSPIRGPLGFHVALLPDGNPDARIKLFAGPGAMLVCFNGVSACELAMSLGFGIKLWDFESPFSKIAFPYI